MAYNKVFNFLAAVRGYHYYRRFWIPQNIKSLNTFLKIITYLIALQSKYICQVVNENAVGHLPQEISCITNFFMDRGAIVSAQLNSEHIIDL